MPEIICKTPILRSASTGTASVKMMKPTLLIVLKNSCLKIRNVLFMVFACHFQKYLVQSWHSHFEVVNCDS